MLNVTHWGQTNREVFRENINKLLNHRNNLRGYHIRGFFRVFLNKDKYRSPFDQLLINLLGVDQFDPFCGFDGMRLFFCFTLRSHEKNFDLLAPKYEYNHV